MDLKKYDLMQEVLSFNLPIIWHNKLKDLKENDILRFIPEGVEYSAKIIFDNDITIDIWKHECPQEIPNGQRRLSAFQKQQFEFQWCPSYVLNCANNSPIQCITKKTCNSTWSNVLKRTNDESIIWDRKSVASINEYLNEVSRMKLY